MFRCITKKENFKHKQEDKQSYNNDIFDITNVKLLTSTVIKFIVNQYCIKVSN